MGLGGRRSGHGDAGEVALHVGDEHRHAGRGKAFGQPLQRHRLAGAGRAGDQAVAVGPAQAERLGAAAAKPEEQPLRIVLPCLVDPHSPFLFAPFPSGLRTYRV